MDFYWDEHEAGKISLPEVELLPAQFAADKPHNWIYSLALKISLNVEERVRAHEIKNVKLDLFSPKADMKSQIEKMS